MMTIDEHTFDERLLTGGWAIDIGCRGFRFTDKMVELGCKVIAMDIENFDRPNDGNVWFKHAALWNKIEPVEVHRFGDGSANFIKGLNDIPYNGPDRPCITERIQAWSLDHVIEVMCSNMTIDILKLDCEAAEYFIMDKMKPIPRQVTVETHAHVHPKIHAEKWPGILEWMSQYYELTTHSNYPQYPYMDCLFIRRDLL